MDNFCHLMNIAVERAIKDPKVRASIRAIYNANHHHYTRGLTEMEYYCGKLLYYVTRILGHDNLRFNINITKVEEERKQA